MVNLNLLPMFDIDMYHNCEIYVVSKFAKHSFKIV